MKNLHLAELLFNQPLMISEGKLNAILHAIGPRFNINMSNVPVQQAAVLSDQDRGRAGYQVVDGVAVIGIYGPLLHRRLASDYPSGGPTTYAEIRKSLDTALADDGVKSILLDVDSPGGMVSGCFDLADHIYQSRGIKPIHAVANESAFSAGYLLASSASRIMLPRTAEVGSVGVISMHADFSRAEDKAGITVTHIFAGARKADGSPHMPLSSEALADWQESVNETYELFVETVARNRGLSKEHVRGTEAGTFKARKAIEARFADEITNFAGAFASAKQTSPSRIITASAEPIGKEKQTMTIEELKQSHPDLCQALVEEGKQQAADSHAVVVEAAKQEGAAAERERIKGIEESCNVPGHEALVASLKFDGKTTASDAALQILGAEKQLRQGALEAMKNQANEAIASVGDGEAQGDEAVNPNTEEAAQANYDKDASLQKEFGSFKSYYAYVKATSSGRARILGK